MNPELIELEPLDDRPGPARPISHARAQELVRGALKRVIAGEGTLATEGKPSLMPHFAQGRQDRPGRLSRMTRAAIVVLGFLIAGGAVAALSSALWSSSDSGARDERPRAPGASGASEHGVDPPTPPAEARPAPAAENAPPTMATAEVNAPGALNQPPHPGGWRKPVVPPRPRALVHPAAPAAAPKLDRTDKAPEAAAPAAEVALSFANHMRGERRWQEAATAYQKVIATFPGSDAAYVATLARAELLLDHLGKPGEALQLFQRTLTRKPSGLLTEEARYGIAACYRAMGDRENERRALGLFLATQPHSLLRSSVEARLAELR